MTKHTRIVVYAVLKAESEDPPSDQSQMGSTHGIVWRFVALEELRPNQIANAVTHKDHRSRRGLLRESSCITGKQRHHDGKGGRDTRDEPEASQARQFLFFGEKFDHQDTSQSHKED